MRVLTVSETSNPSKGCDGHMWHVPIHTDGWAQKSYAHRVPQRYLYTDHPSHLTQSYKKKEGLHEVTNGIFAFSNDSVHWLEQININYTLVLKQTLCFLAESVHSDLLSVTGILISMYTNYQVKEHYVRQITSTNSADSLTDTPTLDWQRMDGRHTPLLDMQAQPCLPKGPITAGRLTAHSKHKRGDAKKQNSHNFTRTHFTLKQNNILHHCSEDNKMRVFVFK